MYPGSTVDRNDWSVSGSPSCSHNRGGPSTPLTPNLSHSLCGCKSRFFTTTTLNLVHRSVSWTHTSRHTLTHIHVLTHTSLHTRSHTHLTYTCTQVPRHTSLTRVLFSESSHTYFGFGKTCLGLLRQISLPERNKESPRQPGGSGFRNDREGLRTRGRPDRDNVTERDREVPGPRGVTD